MNSNDSENPQSGPARAGKTMRDRVTEVADGFKALGNTGRQIARVFSVEMFFVVLFSFLAGLGTLVGMLEVLAAGDNDGGFAGAVLVTLIVLGITLMMVFLLSQAASPANSFGRRIACFLFYIPFLLVSLTFGFAFYWTQLEAKDQAVSDALSTLEGFDAELAIASSNLGTTLESLVAFRGDFAERARIEAATGSQCGEASGGTEGPRSRHLRDRAAEVGAFVDRVQPRIAQVATLSTQVRGEIEDVREMGRASSDQTSPEERNQLFQQAAASGREAAIAISALSADGDIRENVTRFRTWAGEYRQPQLVRTEATTGLTYRCFNDGAANALEGAANRLSLLPQLGEPHLETYSGPEGTEEAVNRIIYTFTHPFSALGSVTEQKNRQVEAARREGFDSGARAAGGVVAPAAQQPPPEGIRSDDYFSLFIAAFVDFSLAFAAFLARPAERFEALARMQEEGRRRKMHPMKVVDFADALRNNDNWQFVLPYMFEHHGEDYIAQPLSRSSDEGIMFFQIITAWKAARIVTRSAMGWRAIKRRLEEVDSAVAQDVEPGRYRAWRFGHRGLEAAILAAMFESDEHDDGRRDRDDA